MNRTTTYVYIQPYSARDFFAFRTPAEAYKFAAGITASGRACHVEETTGNSFDEVQAALRNHRAAYVARLAAQVSA